MVVAVSAIAGVVVYALIHPVISPKSQSTTPATGSDQSNPALDNGAKDSGITDDDSNNSTSSTQTVTLQIVDASQYNSIVEVRAYANASDDGTCGYTFSNGTTSFTKTSQASAGPSTSNCNTIDVPTSNFSAGTWSVKVEYQSTSKTITGSASKTFTVE